MYNLIKNFFSSYNKLKKRLILTFFLLNIVRIYKYAYSIVCSHFIFIIRRAKKRRTRKVLDMTTPFHHAHVSHVTRKGRRRSQSLSLPKDDPDNVLGLNSQQVDLTKKN